MEEASDKPAMSTAAQRVVVIEDASRGVSSSAVKGALNRLSLKPGDELTLVGILHQVNTPMGYKIRVDSSSMLGANKNMIYREVTRTMQEYENDKDVSQIFKFYEIEKVKFSIEVIAGPSTKEVALQAAMDLEATWVILDRKMKKDKAYFLEKLSCRISRLKQNNCIEELRGPKAQGDFQVMYDETIPRFQEEELFSIVLSPTKSLNPAIITLHEEQDDNSSGPALSNSSRSTSFSTFTSSQENTKGSSSMEPETDHIHCHEEENESKAQGKTMEDKSTCEIWDNQGVNQTDTDQKIEDKKLTQNNTPEDVTDSQKIEEMFDHLVCSKCKNKRPKRGCKRDFSYAQLLTATDGFSENNFLSEGGLGPVFSGQLKNMVKIAVKQHREARFQDEDEFKFEVHQFSKIRHKNVVKLLGSCSEGSHRFLVYEYGCNGSLDQHLSQNKQMPLTWMLRLKIALGASRGLNYLHHNNIIHRDIRSTNILLTHDYEPLLGDFGLPRPPSESDQYSEYRVDGSFGYSAPEYVDNGKASTQTDVYSFGVILLELITGRGTADKAFKGTSLAEWARPLMGERKYKELIDPRIVDSHDVHQLSWMVQVTEKCLSKDPKQRSPINSVVTSLKQIIEGNFGVSSPVESNPESQSSAEKGGGEINKDKVMYGAIL